ncbi:hypothetical protein AVEN_42466-1 [Araneus ventricosus]|uniref:Uncharacterized protein n=1 Tax=Araneus ventricosus TaxID=182803 RepID=A0A4Y2J0I7_ARAVE|nr:hypothetical protein AVEN_42466-1 [Araneus ventricosus]
MEVDNAWSWNILYSVEAHFHLQGSVNTQNCRICARENPFQTQPLPLHSQKLTVWYGFTSAFIVGPLFLEEIGPSGPVTCTVNGTCLNLHFRNDRIISRHFSTALPPRSTELRPCYFWLWGYLKDVVCRGSIANLG